MKRFLLAAALLLSASSAFAKWILISDYPDQQLYIERDRIKKTGNNYKFWSMHSYDNYQRTAISSYRSSITQYEVDCKEENIRVHSLIYYDDKDGNGRAGDSYNGAGPWESIVPGTIADQFLKIFCTKK